MKKTLFSIAVLVGALAFLFACHKEKKPDVVAPPPPPRDPGNCLPANLKTGLVAFYPFGNGSLQDVAGGGMPLVNGTGAHTGVDRDGNADCAYGFNGSDGQYLSIAHPTFLDGLGPKPFSVSLWFRCDGPKTNGYEYLIGRGDSIRPTAERFELWGAVLVDCKWPVCQAMGDEVADENQTQGLVCDSMRLHFSYTWHHLVMTYRQHQIEMYLDGQLTTQGSQSVPWPSWHGGRLVIGKGFWGEVDDVAIYDRVLDAAEVAQLRGVSGCCGG
jgi:hypothetical protein